MLFYLFVVLCILSIFLYYKSLTCLVVLFLFLIITIKRLALKKTLILLIISVNFLLLHFTYYKKPQINNNSYIYEVKEEKEKYLIIKKDESYFFVYKNSLIVKVGDKIITKSNLINIENTYNDFYNYLNKQRIYYQLEKNDYLLYEESYSLSNIIINKIFKNRNDKTVSNLNLILFNKKDVDNKLLFNNFSLLSCTYLISISGYQITLLFKLLEKLLFRVKKQKNLISSFIVGFYISVLNFSVSSYRAFIYYIFKKILKIINFDISKVELLAAIGIVFLFINPSYIFNMGFVYSFIFSMSIEIFSLIDYKNHGLKKQLQTYFLMFLLSLPFVLYNSYELNLFSFIGIILLVKPVSYLFVFSLITLFLPKFDLIYNLIVNGFYKFSDLIINKSVTLVFGKPSFVFMIIYYFILIMYFISKENKYSYNKNKYFIYLILVLSVQYCLPYLNFSERVTFVNIGQGDCAVLFIPNSKDVVLIDAGGARFKDNAKDIIIPYLKSKGIKAIDKIIASHDDFDHDGAIPSLIENFKVKKIIDDPLTDKVKIGNKEFINLNVNDEGGNDGSIVLYGEYLNKMFLFTGDISSRIEKSIISRYPSLKVDILKVAHHGSNTSSDEDFILAIKPQWAIISVGKNNYGHPSNKVIQTFINNKVKYLRTDQNNHIELSNDIFIGFYLKFYK